MIQCQFSIIQIATDRKLCEIDIRITQMSSSTQEVNFFNVHGIGHVDPSFKHPMLSAKLAQCLDTHRLACRRRGTGRRMDNGIDSHKKYFKITIINHFHIYNPLHLVCCFGCRCWHDVTCIWRELKCTEFYRNIKSRRWIWFDDLKRFFFSFVTTRRLTFDSQKLCDHYIGNK